MMSRKTIDETIDEMKKLDEMTVQILDDKIKRLKRKRFHILLGLVICVIGCALCLYWFGWKMLLVLSILQFSNNLGSDKI